MKNVVNMFTKRGGQIQTKILTPEIDEIINLKKPRKLKVIRMIFTILRHFFSSMYFFFIVMALYFMRMWYSKYYGAMSVKPEDLKKLKTKFI
jgi:hypothetical protein